MLVKLRLSRNEGFSDRLTMKNALNLTSFQVNLECILVWHDVDILSKLLLAIEWLWLNSIEIILLTTSQTFNDLLAWFRKKSAAIVVSRLFLTLLAASRFWKMFKLLISTLLISTTIVLSSKLESRINISNEPAGFLQKDLNDFLNIIPVNDIRNLTKFFYSNDKAMQESYNYLRDDGFRLVVENLSTLSLVKKFTTFLNESGVNFAELGKRLEGILLTREEAKSIVGNYRS